MKIHRYAHRGDIAGVQQELERGVSIDLLDTDAKFVNANVCFNGMTPLQCALASPLAGADMVKFLYDRGAKRSFDVTQEKSDLLRAIQSGNIEKIQLLLDLGADINCIDAHDDNVLSYDPSALVLQFLIAKGVKIDSDKRSSSVLDSASCGGAFEKVRMLLDAGCDPAVLEWRTDLMQAVGLGTVSELEALLAKGVDLADFAVIDAHARTPWLLSVHMGDVSKAKLLLAAGANPLTVKCDRYQPLSYALESGNLSMLAWLIEIGFDVNTISEHDKTALEYAIELDRADAVSMLLESGAIPVSIAGLKERWIEIRSAEVLKLLLSAGADLNDTGPSSGEGMSITPSIRSLLTKVDLPDEWELDPKYYQADKQRRFGKHNPEEIDAPFWREMVKFRWPAYVIHHLYREESSNRKTIWCFHRFGQSITQLPDERVIEIAGEHEDYYDQDFCIYNDVVVYDGRGDFQIYGYPRDVFRPTDFHTATLVDDWIYIIGNVGYEEDRIVGETPVYRLNCTTFEIEPVITTGECPSWIGCHRAVVRDRQIHISGGKINVIEHNKLAYIDNPANYILDLDECCWYRESISEGNGLTSVSV
jgi:ankyrin repeat protein